MLRDGEADEDPTNEERMVPTSRFAKESADVNGCSHKGSIVTNGYLLWNRDTTTFNASRLV